MGSSAIWQCRTLCLKSRRKAGFFFCIYIGTCPGVFYWIFISCHLPLGTGLAILKKSENLHKDPKAPWFQPSRSHVWPPFPRPQQRWQWWGRAVLRRRCCSEDSLQGGGPRGGFKTLPYVPLSQQTLFIKHKFKNKIIRNSLKPLLSLEPCVGCMPIKFWFQRSAVLMFFKKQWILNP